ncbi:MAG: ATP-binding protein [Blastocatellia bacterium]
MSFATLAGNERNKQILRRLLQRGDGQLGRTLIFAGPDGIGKRLFALTLAKVANCQSLPANGPLDSCDHCQTCRRIDEGTHGDVMTIVPDGQFIKIAQTRALNDQIFYMPREGRQRFFLINDADRLRDEAANSLLKTLKEPPPTSTIILITSRPDALLWTIRSRAQRIGFAPLTIDEMQAFLDAGYPRPAGENGLIARISGGRIGKALGVDLSVYRQERRILLELLELLAGSRSRYRIMKAAEYIAKKEREDFEQTLESINGLLRDVTLLAAGAGTTGVVNIDLVDKLEDLAVRITIPRLILWVERFSELRRQLRVNVNRQVATEAVLLNLA